MPNKKNIKKQCQTNHDEKLYHILQNLPNIAVQKYDENGIIHYWNIASQAIYGYSEQEALGHDLVELIIPPEMKEQVRAIIAHGAKTGEMPAPDKLELIAKDGNKVSVFTSHAIIKNSDGVPEFFSFDIDLTPQNHTENVLLQTQKKMNMLLEHADDVISIHDLQGRYIYFNCPSKYQINSSEILGKTSYHLLRPHEAKVIQGHLEKVTQTGQSLTVEREIHWQGKTIWFSDHIFPLKDNDGTTHSIARICRNITERKLVELKLKKSLTEKDILLKEIHHRVKNNLQLISSMLSLQSSYINNKPTAEAFTKCQTRIKTIALIHDNLYQSNDFEKIDFGNYAKNLAKELFYDFNLESEKISLICDCQQLYLNIDQAIPCGLLLNELITNTCEHAFPNKKNGSIQLCITLNQTNSVKISFADNGIGLPCHIDPSNATTLGFILINGLIRQLKAKMIVDSSYGTCFTISFDRVTV